MYINNDLDYLKILKRKQVFVFGAGTAGRVVVKKLEESNITVKAIADNSLKLQATGIWGRKVISMEKLKAMNTENSIIIIASPKYEREIRMQLFENGIHNLISMDQIDFGGGAEYYDSDYFEWQKRIGEFGAKIKVKMFEKYIHPTDTVVEFGSGGGYLLKLLKAKTKTGIEINESARKHAETLGMHSVATADEIEDEYADVIISTSVLEHVENPLGELKKLYRILKENGKIVFHVPNESCDTEYQRSEINNHLYTWNCLNIGNLFKAAGFFVYSVEKVQEVWPEHYEKISTEMSDELFEDICLIGGKAFNKCRCIIVAYK